MIRLAAFAAAGPLLLLTAQLLPFLTGSNLVIIALAAVASTGLTLIMGLGGQVSLGHAAFYGVGAYALALLTVKAGWPPAAALVAGAALAGGLAALLGVAVLRIQGHFLAMATLAFGLIWFSLVRGWEFSGANQGIGGIPALPFDGDEATFLALWAVLTVGVLVARNLADSRTGRALRALAASEVAAASCGIDVARAKVGVFVIGAVYASVAGSLYAMYVTYIAPDAFGLLASLQFLVMAVVGGLGSPWGATAGAVFVVGLTELSRELVPYVVEDAAGSYEIVAYGLALVLVLLVARHGLTGVTVR
jgi:branched-chain amino acid transport system permease protein